jgi:hypothetical protein
VTVQVPAFKGIIVTGEVADVAVHTEGVALTNETGVRVAVAERLPFPPKKVRVGNVPKAIV